MIKLSIIIPTANRPRELQLCLERIRAQSYGGAIEVIVTDDGTSGGDVVKKSLPEATYLIGPRRGPAANRNNGAAHATGDWLVFIDDDCIPDGGWLEGIAAGIAANPGYSVFEGRVYANRPQEALDETVPGNESGGYLWSCNFAISKKLFDSVGGFDERFPYAAMEDVDLAYRIKKLGERMIFLPAAAVCHPWRKRGGWGELMRHEESTLIYLSIHPDERRRLNSLYYLRSAAHCLIRRTIPALAQGRRRGLGFIALEIAANLRMSMKLLWS